MSKFHLRLEFSFIFKLTLILNNLDFATTFLFETDSKNR